MMQSISHWGQFEMQAAGTANFKETLTLEDILAGMTVANIHPEILISPLSYDAGYLHESNRTA